jgi:hypothetical protein
MHVRPVAASPMPKELSSRLLQWPLAETLENA